MTEQKMYTILTKKGMEAIAKAMAEDKTVNFTNMGIGDGGGVYPQIHENMTQLVNEKWRGKVTSVEVSNQNSKQVKVTALVPLEVGGFNVREVGIFNEVGDLMAIGTYPITWKPDSEDGALSELLIRMIIQVDNSDVVNVTVDDSVVSATKKDLAEHAVNIADAERHGLRVNKDKEFEYFDGSDWKTITLDKGDLRDDGDSALRVQVSETVPPVEDGRIYYNSFRKLFYVGRNGQWYQLMVTGDEKLDKEKPSGTPILISKTDTTVTLREESGMELRYIGGNWQTSGKFTNLERNKSYDFQKRYAEDEIYKASPPSNSLTVRTDKGTQQAPKSPTLSNIEAKRVTVTGEPGTLVRLNTTGYFYSPHTFENLEPERRYTAYAKRPETNTHKESPESPGANFTTEKDQWIFGYEIREDNINPETAIRYIGDNANYRPAKMNFATDSFEWGDWEDFIKELTYPVVLKDGTENYKLQHDDRKKKSNGQVADLTGRDGDVMTFVPHLYRKEERIGSIKRVWLSDKSFEGAESFTKYPSDGYHQYNIGIHELLQDLILLVFKDRNLQLTLGVGYVRGAVPESLRTTGSTDSKPYCYGSNTGTEISFLGIEDIWGNGHVYLDGLHCDSHGIKRGYSNFNSEGNYYNDIQSKDKSFESGYVSETIKDSFIGTVFHGSGSTGYCAYQHLQTDKWDFYKPGPVVMSYRPGQSFGANFYTNIFTIDLSTYGILQRWVTARLCYKNNKGVYVGNYLGTVDNLGLRSVSGKNPTNENFYSDSDFREFAKRRNV